MGTHAENARRAVRELALVVAAGALAGLLSNAASAKRIPLAGDWSRAYGVPSAGGAHSPTYGNTEIGLGDAARLIAGGALLVDARPPELYAEGHIPGAISIPAEAASARLEAALELCEGRAPVVVYCRGLDCDESHLLARALRESGVEGVRVFAGGIDEWRAAGRPVTRGGRP
ncbi:MAG: rhodanese-like domain-containing protein [Chlamydiota bacterium]